MRSYFNVIDPAESGAVAFTISDGNILGLRPSGYEQPVTSQFVGTWVGSGHMTVAEIRRQRREIARRKTEAAQLLARKTRRVQAERRERAAREDAAWAVKHHLPPESIYQPQPRVMMSDFGGLRATPTAYEVDRRARRVDAILESIR